MRQPGSAQSRPKPSVDAAFVAGSAVLLAGLGFAAIAGEEPLRSFAIAGNAIPASLTGTMGDPARGRVVVLDRRLGACLLCHTGPFPEERFQGTLAPDLSGAGSRWSAGELRLRLVDPTRLNPDTIMPPYYRVEGLARVGSAWLRKPILTAGQIEDVVAFLSTLRN
jgi:L-cysteine S-thiosulfotransferase